MERLSLGAARGRESNPRAPSSNNFEGIGRCLIHTATGPLLKRTPGAKLITFVTPPEAKQEGAGRKRPGPAEPGAAKETLYGNALGCFLARGRPSWKQAGNAKNSLRRCVKLFLGLGPAEPGAGKETLYGNALGCFLGPGPAELEAGRKRQKQPTALR